MNGDAAGGGQSQVEPAEKINLHFHGDFHAISSAHNLLAALIDAHLLDGNELDLDPAGITWPRTLDMNDRTPAPGYHRRYRAGHTPTRRRNHPGGFLITAASEIMAILSLASGRADLCVRLARIVIGQNRQGQPVHAADLHATGPMMALLSEALLPNLVQTHGFPLSGSLYSTSAGAAEHTGSPNDARVLRVVEPQPHRRTARR